MNSPSATFCSSHERGGVGSRSPFYTLHTISYTTTHQRSSVSTRQRAQDASKYRALHMRTIHSHEVAPLASTSPNLQQILERISESQLRELVRAIAKPRHFLSEKTNNLATADWIMTTLRSFGYSVERQG